MKRIGPIACKLAANPELMRAALNEPAREFRGGSPTGRTVDEPPMRFTEGGSGAQTGDEIGRAPVATKPGRGDVDYRTVIRPALRIVSSRDRCTAQPPPNGRSPRPAVHLSLVLVWDREAHSRMTSASSSVAGLLSRQKSTGSPL